MPSIRITLPLLILSLVVTARAEVHMVAMRDGVQLATETFLPSGDGPFPVILVRSVYGRSGVGALAGAFNSAGIGWIVQDTRGRGASDGKDMVFADDGWGALQDGADTVAWVKGQPWCNGKIGTWGFSALGITQVLMAGATGDIACQAIGVAASNFYDQLSYQGGVFRKNLGEKWITAQGSPWALAIYKSHPTYDDYWKLHNADARAPQVTAPAVHIGGWFDIFGKGTINNFATRQEHGGPGAKGNQKLIMGAWPHGVVRKVGELELRDNFDFDINGYQLRFFQNWLLDDNGIMSEPAVHYYTLGDVDDAGAPGNEWRTADGWPPFETAATAYYLHGDGTLSTEAPAVESASLSYTYDPADPVPTKGGQNLLMPAGPFDQREVGVRGDVLTFMTGPLEAPVEITGQVRVKLYVSTDAQDTDFAAKLLDVYPDGRQMLMLDNIQRLKFRNGFDQADPLAPGTVGEVEIDLWHISLVVNRGHRIGVQIASSNYPRFEKNPNSGDDWPTEDNLVAATNTIHVDTSRPSRLILPVRE
jgi:uncharacterized protein